MKSWLLYVIVFFGSLLVVVVLTAVAITTKPELFSSGNHVAQKDSSVVHTPKDSTVAHVPKDSAKVYPSQPAPVTQSGTHRDSSQAPAASARSLDDTVKNLSSQVDAEQARIDELNKKLQASIGHSDSVKARETKTMAKLFEAMKAEDAARILDNFTDEEAKSLITLVKKRQAGKILGLMSPERAAKIMRQEE